MMSFTSWVSLFNFFCRWPVDESRVLNLPTINVLCLSFDFRSNSISILKLHLFLMHVCLGLYLVGAFFLYWVVSAPPYLIWLVLVWCLVSFAWDTIFHSLALRWCLSLMRVVFLGGSKKMSPIFLIQSVSLYLFIRELRSLIFRVINWIMCINSCHFV